ncbi:MAG: TlpA family protein disulfide reductase [Actinobacteria bacterium]|nr:TlpA family protein disulfide reductase [Actinomycetota bacterium]
MTARRLPLLAAVLALVLAACGGPDVDVSDVPELPPTTPAELEALVSASEVPVVVNVWASWCGPCRSEAPLFREAAAQAGGDVRFVGIDVRDDQDGARAFIAEFGLTSFEHYFDRTGAVPASLGATGVPLTFFFSPGGGLASTHIGVIDERTLALRIDDLLAGTG